MTAPPAETTTPSAIPGTSPHTRSSATPLNSATPLDSALPWQALTWLTVVAALNVAMAEISRLSGGVLDSHRQAWAYGELMGPSAWVSRDGWRADFGTDVTRAVELRTYLALDVAFIVLYAVAAVRLFWSRYAGLVRRTVLWATAALVVADVTEDVLAWSTTMTDGPVSVGWTGVLARLSVGKSLLGGLVLAAGGYALLTRNGRSAGANLRLVYEVLRTHRLSLVPLVVLGVVAIAPGADILDQAPDIERRWSDTGAIFAVEGLLGVASLGLVGVGLFLLGRARSQLAARDAREAPDRLGGLAPLGWWLVGPVAVLAAALVLWLAGAEVEGARTALFCLPPVLIFVLSRWLRRRHADRAGAGPGRTQRAGPAQSPVPPRRKQWERAELEVLLRTGDALAVGVLALGALGAIRAMTAVVMLSGLGLVDPNRLAVLVFALGAVGVLVLWPGVAVVRRLLSRAYADDRTSRRRSLARWLAPDPVRGRTPMVYRFPELAVAAALLLLVVLGTAPVLFGRGGVLFVLNICLLALTGLVAGAGLIVQRSAPAELFTRLHLRSTPVITLLLVTVVFAGEVSSSASIHTIRATSVPAPPASGSRLGLTEAIPAWARAQAGAGCGRRTTVAGRPMQVLPMVLLAAEGGGIRAAYWTVIAAEDLKADPCARGATLLSSGVSGGAVGLAVQRFNRDPVRVVEEMSDSRALGRGLVGLFVRDFAYAATGIPLPELTRGAPMDWIDRSALMEEAWNTSGQAPGSWRDAPFAPVAGSSPRPAAAVGSVILNSMTVGNACRVWVSELQLRGPAEPVGANADGKIDCDQPQAAGIRSVDLLSAYGSGAQESVGASGAAGTGPSNPGEPAGCLSGLTASTAAMLAARFPYVTPAGRVGPCRRSDGTTSPVDQLVDGGYLENTGLGTVNDLSDEWLPIVQRWNAEQLGQPAGAVPTVIVPVIAYLSNGSGNDQNAPQRDITSEALVPPLARLRAKSGAVADASTLQRAADLMRADRVCPAADPVCVAAVASVDRRVFMIYPGSRPQIAAPLGWVLSEASRSAMRESLVVQRAPCRPRNQPQVNVMCARDYGSLGDLLATVGRPT